MSGLSSISVTAVGYQSSHLDAAQVLPGVWYTWPCLGVLPCSQRCKSTDICRFHFLFRSVCVCVLTTKCYFSPQLPDWLLQQNTSTLTHTKSEPQNELEQPASITAPHVSGKRRHLTTRLMVQRTQNIGYFPPLQYLQISKTFSFCPVKFYGYKENYCSSFVSRGCAIEKCLLGFSGAQLWNPAA